MSLTYQLAAYDWSKLTWENKQVTRFTGSSINHVSLRFGSIETYYGINGAKLIEVSRVERCYNKPLFVTTPRPITQSQLDRILKIVDGYNRCNLLYVYLYHFTGQILPTPNSCTDLVWRCLREIGIDVKHRFLPARLLKEYYECM